MYVYALHIQGNENKIKFLPVVFCWNFICKLTLENMLDKSKQNHLCS